MEEEDDVESGIRWLAGVTRPFPGGWLVFVVGVSVSVGEGWMTT